MLWWDVIEPDALKRNLRARVWDCDSVELRGPEVVALKRAVPCVWNEYGSDDGLERTGGAHALYW